MYGPERHAYQMHAHEMRAYRMHAHRIHAYDMYAPEMHAYEIHAYRIHPYERQVHERHLETELRQGRVRGRQKVDSRTPGQETEQRPLAQNEYLAAAPLHQGGVTHELQRISEACVAKAAVQERDRWLVS